MNGFVIFCLILIAGSRIVEFYQVKREREKWKKSQLP